MKCNEKYAQIPTIIKCLIGRGLAVCVAIALFFKK